MSDASNSFSAEFSDGVGVTQQYCEISIAYRLYEVLQEEQCQSNPWNRFGSLLSRWFSTLIRTCLTILLAGEIGATAMICGNSMPTNNHDHMVYALSAHEVSVANGVSLARTEIGNEPSTR